MSATASILLIMLLRCFSSNSNKVEELMNARLMDIKEQAKIESQRQVQRVDNRLSPQINDAVEDIDSLKHEIKQLKN